MAASIVATGVQRKTSDKSQVRATGYPRELKWPEAEPATPALRRLRGNRRSRQPIRIPAIAGREAPAEAAL